MQPRILQLPRHRGWTKGLQCLMCPSTRVCSGGIARSLLASTYSQGIASNSTSVVLLGVFIPDLFEKRGWWDQISALDVWGKQHLAAWISGVAVEKSAPGLLWCVLCWMATWLPYPSWTCCFCWAATCPAPEGWSLMRCGKASSFIHFKALLVCFFMQGDFWCKRISKCLPT